MTWTPELVRERFVEGADTAAHMITGRVGPGRVKGLWPVYAREPGDAYGYGEVQTRYVPSAAHISRAEEVQAWLSALIDEDRARQIIWARAVCEAEKRSFAAWCRKNRIVRRTAYRLCDVIYERIAASLCKASILLRHPDYGRVSQHGGITGVQIDSLPESASHSHFMADDARPSNAPEHRDMTWAKKQDARRRQQEARRRAKLGVEESA